MKHGCANDEVLIFNSTLARSVECAFNEVYPGRQPFLSLRFLELFLLPVSFILNFSEVDEYSSGSKIKNNRWDPPLTTYSLAVMRNYYYWDKLSNARISNRNESTLGYELKITKRILFGVLNSIAWVAACIKKTPLTPFFVTSFSTTLYTYFRMAFNGVIIDAEIESLFRTKMNSTCANIRLRRVLLAQLLKAGFPEAKAYWLARMIPIRCLEDLQFIPFEPCDCLTAGGAVYDDVFRAAASQAKIFRKRSVSYAHGINYAVISDHWLDLVERKLSTHRGRNFHLSDYPTDFYLPKPKRVVNGRRRPRDFSADGFCVYVGYTLSDWDPRFGFGSSDRYISDNLGLLEKLSASGRTENFAYLAYPDEFGEMMAGIWESYGAKIISRSNKNAWLKKSNVIILDMLMSYWLDLVLAGFSVVLINRPNEIYGKLNVNNESIFNKLADKNLIFSSSCSFGDFYNYRNLCGIEFQYLDRIQKEFDRAIPAKDIVDVIC